MASASSSSGPAPNAPRKNDVFISFRGEDTRYNFTSHLHAALNGALLKVFRDDKNLEKGDEIKPSLIQAIKDSSVSVIVFSKDYASSKWCLDELHQIVQYRKDEGQYLIPIFYKVDPTDVRHQTGAYEEAFEKYDKNSELHPDRVNGWRAALSEAGQLSGFHCQTSTDESNLIKDIVTHVDKKLKCLYNCQVTLKDAIGIDETIKPIEELLEKSDKVGIWGMGGLGKTTMAKALFAKLSFRYHNCCFLENIREAIARSGSKDVCNSLVSGLLGPNTHNNSSNAFGRTGFLDAKLRHIKAFVVLDDVESSEQLEDLKELCDVLGEGSKVIITTRDMRLLRGNGYNIHEAKGLDYDNSRRLFIYKAFGPNHPEYVGYEHLIDGFVDYTQHNPLALKVLGTFLAGSVDEKEWDSLLRELRAGNPDDRIQKVLRLSYDNGLKYKEQQIFLDIACFLKGESEEFVEELLKSYTFYSTIGIQTLIDKALIVKSNGKVEMHDLLQEMGLQIVREESKEEPGKRSRLWDPSEIYDVLKNCEGEKEVQGIMFEISRSRPLKLTAKAFNEMKRIRFLKFYSSNGMVTIPTSLELISTKIRYFHWEGYPGKSLPSNFCAELLLELNLKESMVETLWEGVQDLANLRRLILSKCHNLRKLPDLSKACSLESVDLSHCERLRDMDASLLLNQSLISLDFSYCSDLITELPVSLRHLSKLQYLSVKGCTALRSLPELPPSFRKLIATDCTSLENVSIAKRFLFTKPSEEQAKGSLLKADHEKERVTVSYSFLPEMIRIPSIFL
ncbi:hypothetical protein QN277_016288 [Acacia crassicarpa]|uniref:TIR domain-containing protein n=1 Tax=Acacia crassicarpa TaxID=499986 RepID=A0AAE1MWC0_9FABA|nr:hypothetical protein QN277_016288 [Acacia crassicarpa]